MSNKRALLVTSHKNNGSALGHFLSHLRLCEGYGTIDVYCVVGGYDAYTTEEKDGVTYVYSPYNAIDYTGLLAVFDLPELVYESYFYVHDTTRPGPSFLKKILALPSTLSTASFHWPSMNIGLYSRDVLYEHKALLDPFRNDSSSVDRALRLKARCVECEDCIFRANAEHHVFFSFGPPAVEGPVDYYGNGTPRIIEYYETVDLYKIKANWYVKPRYELCL